MIGTVADVTNLKKVQGELKKTETELNLVTSEQEEKITERTEELLMTNLQLKIIIEELDRYTFIISQGSQSTFKFFGGSGILIGSRI
jgi:C4-dicarboxylate-specific signal transduction histidine kinase